MSCQVCKTVLPYNFALASANDAFVYGSGRPGPMQQRNSATEKTKPEEVQEWTSFMKEKGIEHVVNLLTESELATYSCDVIELLRKDFKSVTHTNVKSKDELEEAIATIKEAVDNKEKVVVHCWGGGGRAGLGLGAWLVKGHGASPEEAAKEIVEFAKAQGASRRVDPEQLKSIL